MLRVRCSEPQSEWIFIGRNACRLGSMLAFICAVAALLEEAA